MWRVGVVYERYISVNSAARQSKQHPDQEDNPHLPHALEKRRAIPEPDSAILPAHSGGRKLFRLGSELKALARGF
jgi:hypothetical protein